MLTVADTAYAIAHIRALESSRLAGERLFDDPHAAHFDAAGGHARDGVARFVSLPFFVDGIRLRTRGIDDVVRAGLAAGLSQVVLMGVGFDARALRMPELGAARVFEVDQAVVLDAKRAVLTNAGVALPANVAYVACDFEAPGFEGTLTEALVAAGFVIGAGVLFVWEGVVAYLRAETIARSLRFMAELGGPGSRVVFDFAEGHFDLGDLRAAGFTDFEEIRFDDLWRRHMPGDPHEAASIVRLGVALTRSGRAGDGGVDVHG